MRKILIFLFLTAPLAWAGPKIQKSSIKKEESGTRKEENPDSPQKYIQKEEGPEEDIFHTLRGPQVYQNPLFSLSQIHPTDTPLGEKEPEKEESPEEELLKMQNIYSTDTALYGKEEFATRAGPSAESSIERERRREQTNVRNMFKKWGQENQQTESPGGDYNLLAEKLAALEQEVDELKQKKEERSNPTQGQTSSGLKPWKKDSSVIDDAIYAAKNTQKEEEPMKEGVPPAGARGVIKRAVLYGGLVALGYFAKNLEHNVFPKDTKSEELDPLINQMNNFTLNATTESKEETLNATTESEKTSWFGQELLAPLNHATTHVTNILGDSWNTLWGSTEESQKEISSNGNYLPETEKLPQKGSKTATEL